MDRLAVAMAVVLAAGATARAEVLARVLTQTAPVRSGPGSEYRQVRTAVRDEVLGVRGRGSRGYWLLIALDDGTTGWVLGEEVATFEVGDDQPGFWGRAWRGIRRALLGPSPVLDAGAEISFSAGVLGGEGLFLVRPAWLVDPYFALEAFVGASPGADQDLLLAGAGWTLRLLPGAAVAPYLHASVGVVRRDPKVDVYTVSARSQAAVDVGGGIEVALRARLTLRVDFREWVFFDQNSAEAAREVSGGLAVFF